MFPQRIRALLSTMATLAVAVACGGDYLATTPTDVEAEGPVLKPAFSGTGQTAKLFIADAFGANLLRYEVTAAGGATADGTIPLGGAARGITFSPTGEMFVAHTGTAVDRFLDPENAATPNGSITAANTGAPFGSEMQWSDFRNGELLQNQASGIASRFTFDASGNATLAGTFSAGSRGLLANHLTGEVFSTSGGGAVNRHLIDAAGNVTSNGSFGAGGSGSHGMAVTAWGELLVANHAHTRVSRFTFDAAGNPVPNGEISGNGMAGPLDVDISPWGEVFITNHGGSPALVTRWVFSSPDASGTAIYNGSFSVPTTIGVLRFFGSPHGGGGGNNPPILTADSDPVIVFEGTLATNTGIVSDAEGDPLTLTASIGTVVDNNDGTWSWSLDTTGQTSQTVTIDADDGNGGTSQIQFELDVQPSGGQTAKLFIADAFGSTNLLRYAVSEGGGAIADGTIPLGGAARGIAFSPTGEMFVAHTGTAVDRFLDPENAATPNGSITPTNTGAPFASEMQWSDFRNGELLQNQANGNASRFAFDAAGNATLAGTFSAGARGLLANHLTGEVFSTSAGSAVHRYLIDAAGNVTANGAFGAGGGGSHGMAVTGWGELLVANHSSGTVSRFTFDASGNAVPNGSISGNGMAGPLDVDISPWGEVFVTNHGGNPALVTRWVFSSPDASGTATYNGSFSVPTTIGVLRFFGSPHGGGGPPNAAPFIAADANAIAVDEGQTAGNTGTVSDPDGDPVTLSASVGTVVDQGGGTWSWSFDTTDGPAESQTVIITVEDDSGETSQTSFTLTVSNVAPVVTSVTFQADPVAIDDPPVSASGTFFDPAGAADETYTCLVDYGDGTGLHAGTVSGTTCQGPSHSYATPGVYSISMEVTDKDGAGVGVTSESFLVIYDPEGGFVTGGGWIDSPPGALVADPSLAGKANFGFVSKYKKGANVPTGSTEFQFKTGDLNFHSSNYEWLVVTGGATARFKGSGTINGQGDYRFMIWATDSSPDTFRIRIWSEDAAGNETDVYDNGFQEIGGGSIRVHQN